MDKSKVGEKTYHHVGDALFLLLLLGHLLLLLLRPIVLLVTTEEGVDVLIGIVVAIEQGTDGRIVIG